MRGRTNVGDGVSLNANTVNKTVKSGQIIAGDFVEYFTVENLLEEGSRIYFAFNIGIYSIALKNKKISLFKNNIQVDQFTNYDITTINNLYLYNNYVLFISSNSRTIGVLSIDTTADRFVLKSTEIISDFYSGEHSTCAIAANNGVIVACSRSSSSSSTQKYTFITASINSGGEISNVVSSISYNYYNNALDWIESYNGIFCWIHGTGIYSLIIDGEGKVSENYNDSFGSYSIKRKLYQNNDIVIYSIDHVYQGNGDIEILNLTSKTHQQLGIQGMCATNIDNDLFVTYYYYNSQRKLHLYKYNNVTKEVTKIDTLDNVDVPAGSSTTILYTDCSLANSSFLLFEGYFNNVYKYKYYRIVADSSIQNIVDEDYVIAYQNSGHPIGVAKTNGNVNDVIPIYVPTPSV